MDFFEHQAVARKQTARLVVLFSLAVSAICCGVYALFTLLDGAGLWTSAAGSAQGVALFEVRRLLIAALLVGILVGGGSALRISQLRGGGRSVAESLGGKLLVHGGEDQKQQRLLNVVEEMAIASGTPLPAVFLLERETGINAFAAGFSAKDAVIGVTRGTLEQLDRDELQGVIAHEFSHILNGDMRLNVRLIGVLYGIVCMSLFGRTLLHSSRFEVRSSRSERQGLSPVLGMGLGLLLIGALGSFFARWIQAAVSRQREYLADASAVQFTRQTDGITRALERIAGLDQHSYLQHARAGEVRHMLFGADQSGFMSALFATHPPLAERIKRLRAGRPGTFAGPERKLEPAGVPGSSRADPGPFKNRESASRASKSVGLPPGIGLATSALTALAAEPAFMARAQGDWIAQAAGTLTRGEIQYAGALIALIPGALKFAAQDPFGACALCFALLLPKPDANHFGREVQRLQGSADPRMLQELKSLLPLTQELEERLRLPLLDLALVSLRELSKVQYRDLRAQLLLLIEADAALSPFELCLRSVIFAQLDPLLGDAPLKVRARAHLDALREEAWVVISCLAHFAGPLPESVAAAYQRAIGHLPSPLPEAPLALQASQVRLEPALTRLALLAPLYKREFLTALWHLVLHDREVRVIEAELFRAISAVLACPMPPLLAGQPVDSYPETKP